MNFTSNKKVNTSMMGSIGVIGTYFDFSEALEFIRIKHKTFTAGDYKDMGKPA